MIKCTVVGAILVLGIGTALSQSNDIQSQSEALLYTYLSGDSAKIYPNWHTEKDESFRLTDWLAMQTDAFGQTSLPTSYEYSQRDNHTEKTISITLEMHHVFSESPSAKLRMHTFKGNKRKSTLQIDDIHIETTTSNGFLDSLSAPYLKLIANNEIDSLLSIAFQVSRLQQVLDDKEQSGSKKDKEKAKAAMAFMESMKQLVRESLASVEASANPEFTQATMVAKKGVPRLLIAFTYPAEKGKK